MSRLVRALLSDRYRRIDNLEVASAILPLFAGKEEMEVVSINVSENKLHIKIVNHRLEMSVVPGDLVQAGVVTFYICCKLMIIKTVSIESVFEGL